jgi:cyclin-dependent kinase regulatory subunit CKS1
MSASSRIEYSEKYADDIHEYRHVILPKELVRQLPRQRLLSEAEWRNVGVQQSRGWVHYAVHRPEPHILLFRRPLGTDPQSGHVDPELERQARDEYKNQFGLKRK